MIPEPWTTGDREPGQIRKEAALSVSVRVSEWSGGAVGAVVFYRQPENRSAEEKANLMIQHMAELLEIQELDKERLQLEEQLRLYPEVWGKTKKRRDRLEKAWLDSKDAGNNVEKERRRVEEEISTLRESLKKYEGQLAIIRTQREASALSSQVDQTKLRLSRLEGDSTALLDREKASAEAREKAEAEFRAAETEAAEEKDRIRGQIREKKDALAKTLASIEKLRGSLDGELYAQYTRLSRRYPGNAVVPVRSKSCSGCNFQLLPHKLVVLRKGAQLAVCDNCGRLLSEDEDLKLQAAGGTPTTVSASDDEF